MNTFTKKRSYFLSLIVSVFVLTLSSTAWSESERLILFMSDSYMLNFAALDADAMQEYLDEEINPIIEQAGQEALTSTRYGLLIIHSRDNLSGDDGSFIGNGEDCAVVLFLVVIDPAAPNRITLLNVESFQSNRDVVNYLVDKGLVHPRSRAQVNTTQVTKSDLVTVDNNGTKTKELAIDFWDQHRTVSFATRFIAPEPYYEPLVVEDVVSEIPYRLRYCYAPEKVFSISILRKIFEPLVEDADFRLNIDVSGPAGEFFNALDENNVTRLRFVHQIMVIDEIL